MPVYLNFLPNYNMNPNQLKSINGYNAKTALLQQLQELQAQAILSLCKADYRNGYEDYDPDQFFAPFYIEFSNGVGWLIFASTSVRNDRMNNQQWSSYHIKKISPNIQKSYLIVPDDILENRKELFMAQSYNNKIFYKKMYSAIDAVLTQSQLIEAIISYNKQISSPYTMNVGNESVSEPLVPYGHSVSDYK